MLDAESVVWHPVSTTEDKYGDGTSSPGTPVILTALVAARTSAENASASRPGVIVGKQLYLLDAPAEPGASDWFEVRGARYEVDGQAHRWSGTQVEVSVKYIGDLP